MTEHIDRSHQYVTAYITAPHRKIIRKQRETIAKLLEALKITLEALQAWKPLFKDDWDVGDDNAVEVAEQAIRNADEQEGKKRV